MRASKFPWTSVRPQNKREIVEAIKGRRRRVTPEEEEEIDRLKYNIAQRIIKENKGANEQSLRTLFERVWSQSRDIFRYTLQSMEINDEYVEASFIEKLKDAVTLQLNAIDDMTKKLKWPSDASINALHLLLQKEYLKENLAQVLLELSNYSSEMIQEEIDATRIQRRQEQKEEEEEEEEVVEIPAFKPKRIKTEPSEEIHRPKKLRRLRRIDISEEEEEEAAPAAVDFPQQQQQQLEEEKEEKEEEPDQPLEEKLHPSSVSFTEPEDKQQQQQQLEQEQLVYELASAFNVPGVMSEEKQQEEQDVAAAFGEMALGSGKGKYSTGQEYKIDPSRLRAINPQSYVKHFYDKLSEDPMRGLSVDQLRNILRLNNPPPKKRRGTRAKPVDYKKQATSLSEYPRTALASAYAMAFGQEKPLDSIREEVKDWETPQRRSADIVFTTIDVPPFDEQNAEQKKLFNDLKQVLEKHVALYCSRAIEPGHFLRREQDESLFLCPSTQQTFLTGPKYKSGIEMIDPGYFSNHFQDVHHISLAVATLPDEDKLLGFATSSDRKNGKAELLVFCAAAAASSEIEFPSSQEHGRFQLNFYKYFEDTIKNKGYQKIVLTPLGTSERFWYQRGYRYSECDVPDQFLSQQFCQRPKGRDTMYKCIQ